MVRADLQMYGLIGFKHYWVKSQGYSNESLLQLISDQGDSKKNLLQLISNQCFDREIDICAITSSELQIPRESLHDRFNYLVKESFILPFGYKSGKLGNNVLVVEKGGKKVYFVNGQNVITKGDGKRIDHLVVGSNEVPNLMSLRDTLKYGKDNGLLQIAKYPFVTQHFGIGEDRLRRYLEDYDAIEGHNSQLALPRAFSILPFLGQLSKTSNDKAKQFALENNKPYISSSDAHWIEDAGLSYIEFEGELNGNSGEKIIGRLRDVVRSGNFKTVENYSSLPDVVSWFAKMHYGKRFHKDKI